MWTFDFETEPIEGNTSRFPPKPVGLAVRHPDGLKVYLTDPAQMSAVLHQAWDDEMLFHGGKFDIAVAMHHFGLKFPKDPTKVHDTMYLVFLHNPHARSLALKESAEDICGIAPEERDLLQEWIIRNISGANKKNWGAFICKAPYHIVEPYALGDIERTFALYEKLMPIISQKGMLEAYKREQKLMPILMEAERRGLRVDMKRLEEAMGQMEIALHNADLAIYKILGVEHVDLDSPAELTWALEKADAMSVWGLTPKGKKSVAKPSLRKGIRDRQLLLLLLYRGSLSTFLETFGRPWMADAQQYGGRLHPNWNQVRSTDSEGFFGTRTGRLSCDSPNLTNPPNEVKDPSPEGFPDIPLMRSFLLPEEGYTWLKRDFSSQEIRVLAHYEDGELMRRFQADPNFDPHQMAKDGILSITGIDLDRKYVKITAFSIIYGAGVTRLAQTLEIDYGKATSIREGYMSAIPGIRVLSNALRSRGRAGQAMRTLGGRLYLPEPPRLINGSMRSFEYKLLNYLIQGSSADQTKESILDWDSSRNSWDLFLAALHDEMDICCPIGQEQKSMKILKEAMNKPRLDVPVLSEGFFGKNFGELNDFVEL